MTRVDGSTGEAKNRLRALSSACGDLLWTSIAEACDRFDATCGEAHRDREPVEADDPEALLSLLARDAGADRKRLQPLREIRAQSSPEEWKSIEVALLRALRPRAALATVPAQRLFTEREWEDITRHPRSAREVMKIDLNQPSGKPADYRGYLCVIAKLTRLCNLRCGYCKDWSASPTTTMSTGVLTRVVEQCLQEDFAAVDFIWHGGEPLMAGRSRLLRLLSLQQYFTRPGQVVRNHLQTNAAMVSERWAEFLAAFNIRASVSLDGPAEIHDRTRVDTRGRASWARVRAGMDALIERNLLSGILIVVSRPILDLGADRLLAFAEQEAFESICLLAERPGPGGAGGISQAQYVHFLCEIEQASRRLGTKVRVREIEACRRALAGRSSGFCELAGNCIGTFITAEADGRISHCDKYYGDSNYDLGNIVEEPLREILAGPAVSRLRQSEQDKLSSLRNCSHFHACQGWCPHERYVSRTAGTCCGLAPLFETLSEGSREEWHASGAC